MPKILIVDDDEMNRDMLARRLLRKGYEVTVGVNGREATQMAVTESPDIILMDMSLPEMDGWAATRSIRNTEGGIAIPIIALTAHASSEDQRRALESGCDDFDTKPVEFTRLVQKIELLLRAGRPASPGPARQLAAVFFADLVGYSELSSQNETRALHLVNLLQNVSRKEIPAHGGRVVKFVGDAVLAEFASSDAAIRSAHALKAALASVSEGDAVLRIGLHLGEVTKTIDGDIYGDSVNVAARLQHLAQPDQILVTGDVWRQVRRTEGFSFQSVGLQTLKGITDPVETYTVQLEGT